MIVPHTDEFYHDAIKRALPCVQEICTPTVNGTASPVFLAKCPKETMVCKFNDYNIVMHNRKIRELLIDRDINISPACAHAFGDAWFESYKYCPDKTLYEHVNEGFTDKQIINAYQQVVNIQNILSQIPKQYLATIRPLHYAEVFRATHKHKMHEPFVSVYSGIINATSRAGTTHLLHCDLNPRNILTDDKGNVTSLLDLDAVVLATDEFALIQMLRNSDIRDVHKMIEYYEYTTDRPLNRGLIISALKTLDALSGPRRAMRNLFMRDTGAQK